MKLNKAIEMLEAEGFHLYRKILNSEDVIVGLLVLPALDLYAKVGLSGNDARVTFTGGELNGEEIVDTAADDLKKQLRVVLYKAKQHSFYHDKDEEEWDVSILDHLAELEKETGRTFDRVWQGSDEYIKVLYRGFVLEINNELEVLSVNGKQFAPDDWTQHRDDMLPLGVALSMLDEKMARLEENPVEEEELEA